jgi:hypothetical protein
LTSRLYFKSFIRKRDSSIGIATGYGLDGRGSIPDRRKRLFSILQHPDQLWDPSYIVGMGTLFSGVKQPRCKSDHSPPFTAEVKNGGAIPSLPHLYSWHSA